MTLAFSIAPHNPNSSVSQAMIAALWNEIQNRYHFTGKCDINPNDFTGSRALFLIVFANNAPVGSIDLKPLSEDVAELNALYVAPEVCKQGVAQALLHECETFSSGWILHDSTTCRHRAA